MNILDTPLATDFQRHRIGDIDAKNSEQESAVSDEE